MSRRPRPSWYRESPPKHQTPLPEMEDDDDEVVVLPQVDNEAVLARLNLSLVGRIFHKGGRSLEALITTLPKDFIWNVEGRVRGVPLGDSRFQFYFESEADLQKVHSKRPCHFNRWSFALERWEPHVGSTFPDSMTFWIRFDGIPSEYWTVETLTNFGTSLGTVLETDTINGRIQVSVKADAPLKFRKKTQIPSGEVVSVALFDEKLIRWCNFCRRICHEAGFCPHLNKEQRILYQRQYETEKAFRAPAREGNPYSRAVLPPQRVSGSRRGRERHLRDGSSGSHSRSSLSPVKESRKEKSRWDSPNRRQSSPRSSHPYPDGTSLPYSGKGKEVEEGKKRRLESHSLIVRDPLGPGLDKGEPSHAREPALCHNSLLVASEPSQIAASDSQATISESYLPRAKEKQGYLSPAFARERPFRLNLQKKSIPDGSSSLGAKNRNSPPPELTPDTGSSVKKSLRFTTQETPQVEPLTHLSFEKLSLADKSAKSSRRKSWYEMTLEEDDDRAQAEGPEPDKEVGLELSPSDEELELNLMDRRMMENDDLLGDDLHAELQNQEALTVIKPTSPASAVVSPKSVGRSSSFASIEHVSLEEFKSWYHSGRAF
ncbi:uncharacterized protein LOC111829068 [Capsella rubella]|uniref:uncharacterized protein LOC111829068 n=1 Tax=Capsella rubella TaxID=81985 RepID=UPI000CD4A0AE|nr:uncharacterized protein LOC111829068 [Capsella rubella]